LDAVARIGVPADHRGIICNRHVFRILKHWLKAGEPDPFYNPLNDFVILPTAFEAGDHNEDTDIHVTSVKEDWQLLSQNDYHGNGSDDLLAMVGSLSVSREGMDSLTDGAHVTVAVQQTDCIA
jgi:phospholipase A1